LPELFELLRDEEMLVQNAAFECLVELLDFFPVEVRTQKIVPFLRPCAPQPLLSEQSLSCSGWALACCLTVGLISDRVITSLQYLELVLQTSVIRGPIHAKVVNVPSRFVAPNEAHVLMSVPRYFGDLMDKVWELVLETPALQDNVHKP
jgi:hypothetical protein